MYSQNSMDGSLKLKVTTEGNRIYMFEGKFSKRFQKYSGKVKIYRLSVSVEPKTEEFAWDFVDRKVSPDGSSPGGG